MSGRYIDADALRHMVLYFADANNLDGNHEQTKAYNHCICMIDDRKTADVRENVHGEWVLDHPSQLWECTNCHEREIRTTDFCPWCGADMRKGETNG